ncbi:MAG: lipoyl synthase [bacterium]
MSIAAPLEKKPPWLRVKISSVHSCANVGALVRQSGLHTVCESARCPNLGECWSRGTATLMILGNICSRRCGFCAIASGNPLPPDPGEPLRAARAAFEMKLRHVVVTSVTRDDLPDGGAAFWAETIRAIRRENPNASLETLIPDFGGKRDCLEQVLRARPDVLNHNVETVPRLYPTVRPQAKFERSLELLRLAKKAGLTTKTGLMLGIGEREDEIEEVLRALVALRVDMLTLGQYLRPTARHLPVERWVSPEEFARWKERGLKLGFRFVQSGPLVRSSYRAEEAVAPLP